jgi:hypothetical protein
MPTRSIGNRVGAINIGRRSSDLIVRPKTGNARFVLNLGRRFATPMKDLFLEYTDAGWLANVVVPGSLLWRRLCQETVRVGYPPLASRMLFES